jgi:hypothetical protein
MTASPGAKMPSSFVSNIRMMSLQFVVIDSGFMVAEAVKNASKYTIFDRLTANK